MVSIGGRYGIADLMGISLRGWPANFMKHMVNIHYLLTIGGLKNGAKYTLDYLETQGQEMALPPEYWAISVKGAIHFSLLFYASSLVPGGCFLPWIS